MHPNRSIRRIAVGAAAGLVAVVAVPAPASALPIGDGFVRAIAEVTYDDAACSLTDGNDAEATSKQWDSATGARTSQTVNEVTVANDGAPLDSIHMSGTARSRAVGTVSGGSLDEARLTGEAAVSWRAVLGGSSSCDGDVSARASSSFDFTTRRKGRVVIVWSARGGGDLYVEGIRADGRYTFVVHGGAGSGQASFPVPGGVLVHEVGLSFETGIGQSPFSPSNQERTRKGSYDVTVRFKPAS